VNRDVGKKKGEEGTGEGGGGSQAVRSPREARSPDRGSFPGAARAKSPRTLAFPLTAPLPFSIHPSGSRARREVGNGGRGRAALFLFLFRVSSVHRRERREERGEGGGGRQGRSSPVNFPLDSLQVARLPPSLLASLSPPPFADEFRRDDCCPAYKRV